MRKSRAVADSIHTSVDDSKVLRMHKLVHVAALELPLPRTSGVFGGDFVTKGDATATRVKGQPRGG